MGLALNAVKMLLRESIRKPLGGRVLTLGRQTVQFTAVDLRASAAEFGVALAPVRDTTLSIFPHLAAKGYLSDDSLFELLGFSEFESMDYSDFEKAHITFDLNKSECPEHLKCRYDFIIDSGTMEHVFHVPNLLANLHAMLRPGGRVMHLSPAANYIDHGFYCFSPTFFNDYYSANKYELNVMQMVKHTPQPEIPWELSDYSPGCLGPVSFGGLDDAAYHTLCVATKTPNSTSEVIPQQGIYRTWWVKADDSASTPQRSAATPLPLGPALTGRRAKLKKFIKDRPLIYGPLRKLRHAITPRPTLVPPRKGLGLEVVARY
jgi:hypothetical protein